MVYPSKIREQDHIHFEGGKGEYKNASIGIIRKKENKNKYYVASTHVGCGVGPGAGAGVGGTTGAGVGGTGTSQLLQTPFQYLQK